MADESDDDFVSYGTSLKPLEDEVSQRKPVSLEDQVVTDKQGRRRFHGAFTGGFSAGYFNSVGTKEGWTPATFVSSRGQRAADGQSRRRAEDFMDEEDLGDFGIAPRKIVTTEKFAGEEKTRKRLPQSAHPSIIPGESPLQDLIVPNNDSMGARLLRKMGWRHGQGVGPKVRRRKKKSAPTEPEPEPGASASDSDGGDSNFYRDFLFAPDDVEEMAMKPKDDNHGIGYRGLDPALAGMGQHVSLFEERPVYSRGGRRGISGQAFGVGAFETADDDIYGTDSMSNYDRVLGEEDPGGGNFGWTAPKGPKKGSAGMLENFKASAQGRPPNKVFPPPVLPKDFRPFHTVGRSSKENRPPGGGSNFKSSRFMLSATQRAAMLGEEQLPGPSSVFDFLSPDDRQKLKSSSSSAPVSSAATPKPRDELESKAVPGRFHHQALPVSPAAPTASDPQQTQTQGGGYKPFAADAAKQQRYEEYLARKRAGQGPGVAAPSDGLTEWERQRETEEFVRASSLYQPLSGLMAARFVSAKNNDDEETVDIPAEEGGDKSSQAAAADMKMYGKLTRDSLEWHPDSLLCKRFNLPNPYPGSDIVGLPTVKKDKFSLFNFLTIDPSSAQELPTPPAGTDQGSRGSLREQQPDHKSSRWDKKPSLLADIGISDRQESPDAVGASVSSERGNNKARALSGEAGEVDQPTDVEPAESRPPMDLFKAIFDSSSSSSNEEEDEETSDDNDDGKKDKVQVLEESSMGEKQTEEDIRQSTLSVPTTMVAADNDNISGIPAVGIGAAHQVAGTSTTPACIFGAPPPSRSADPADDELYYGPSLPPPSSTDITTTSSPAHGGMDRARGHHKQRQKQRDTSGGRKRSRDHRKEKRRKKREGAGASRHKRNKDKKHKSKTKKKSKKKESKVRVQGRHRSSSSKSEYRGPSHRTSDIGYEASGSSSSSDSSSSDDSS